MGYPQATVLVKQKVGIPANFRLQSCGELANFLKRPAGRQPPSVSITANLMDLVA